MNKYDKKDLILRGLSILLAFLLWSYVITDQNPIVSKDFRTQVMVKNVNLLSSKDLTILEDTNSFYVNVRLRGRKDSIDKITATSITAIADVRGYDTPGDMVVPVELSGIPSSVNIVSKAIETINMKIEKLTTKELPIEVNITGKPLIGTAINNAYSTPSIVTIKGAESIVNSIKVVSATLDITGQKVTIVDMVKPEAYNGAGQLINTVGISPALVEITVPIENTKSVPVELDYDDSILDNYMIRNVVITPANVNITGKESKISSITSIKTVKVDLTNNKDGIINDIELVVPENVILLEENPKVSVKVVLAPMVDRTITVKNIKYLNIPENIEVATAPTSVSLKFRGLSEDAYIMEKAVYYVDLSNVTEGDNQVNLQYEPVNLNNAISMELGTILIHMKNK